MTETEKFKTIKKKCLSCNGRGIISKTIGGKLNEWGCPVCSGKGKLELTSSEKTKLIKEIIKTYGKDKNEKKK